MVTTHEKTVFWIFQNFHSLMRKITAVHDPLPMEPHTSTTTQTQNGVRNAYRPSFKNFKVN